MNWKNILIELSISGLSEKEIADQALVSPSTIRRLKSGDVLSPRHDIGELLIKLHKERINNEKI